MPATVESCTNSYHLFPCLSVTSVCGAVLSALGAKSPHRSPISSVANEIFPVRQKTLYGALAERHFKDKAKVLVGKGSKPLESGPPLPQTTSKRACMEVSEASSHPIVHRTLLHSRRWQVGISSATSTMSLSSRLQRRSRSYCVVSAATAAVMASGIS